MELTVYSQTNHEGMHLQKPPSLTAVDAQELCTPTDLKHLLLSLRALQNKYSWTLLKLREQYFPGGLLKSEVEEIKASFWERSKRTTLQGELKKYNLRHMVRLPRDCQGTGWVSSLVSLRLWLPF